MQNIEEIYKKYANDIYKYLLCLTNNKDIAEDLTQETFLIAVKEIHKFKGNCKLPVWLCQIAKHLYYKQIKKKEKNKTISIEELPEEIEEFRTTEDIICKKETKLNFFKDLQKLDEDSKEIIYLRLMGNLDFTEIGEILGKNSNWARVKFFRAKQKIMEVSQNGKKIRM